MRTSTLVLSMACGLVSLPSISLMPRPPACVEHAQEKNGSLTFLAPNIKDVLGRVDFFNLGIYRLAYEEMEAGPDQVRRVSIELYCERMEFASPAGG